VSTSIGHLRHRLVLEAATSTPDGAGGVIETWSEIATISAAVRSSSGRERMIADGLQSRITHEVIVRTRADILPRHRFRRGSRVLHILAVMAADPRGTRLRCLCEERDL
jgi:SPP1 family predicted phage head-tail adaptor